MAPDTDSGSGSLAALPEAPDPADKNRLFLRQFLQNQRRLYAYILTILPNRADADDVLQEASLVMWDKFDELDPPADFLAWARRVAYYKVLDCYKSGRRLRTRLGRVMLDRVAESAAEQADVLQLDERREALAACLAKLRPAFASDGSITAGWISPRLRPMPTPLRSVLSPSSFSLHRATKSAPFLARATSSSASLRAAARSRLGWRGVLALMKMSCHSTASSMSASSNTTNGDLPPSSRLTRLMSRAAAAMIFEPTGPEPVKASLSTPL